MKVASALAATTMPYFASSLGSKMGIKVGLTAHESAGFIGVSIRRFYELTATEGFPAARALGGPRSRRWLSTALLVWMESLPPASADEPIQLRKAKLAPRPTEQLSEVK